MTLPTAVASKVNAANAILDEMRAPPEPEVDQEAPAEQETQATDDSSAADGTHAEQAQPTEAQPAPVPGFETDEYKTMEQRYRTLQGLHRSQKQATQQVREENEALRAQLADMQAQLQAKSAPAPAPAAPSEYDTDYGSDMVEMVRTLARAEAQRLLGDASERFTRVESQAATAIAETTQTRQERLFDKLTAVIPNWREVNDDEMFHAWLAEVDPVYGMSRQQALNDAAAVFDEQRVIALFKAYVAQTQPPQQPADTRKAQLARQLEPTRSSATHTAAPQNAAATKVWTQAEVTAFYNGLVRGSYRGREQEAERVKAEINRAMAEGRIQ